MSAATSLPALVERYLVERHRLGFSDRTSAYSLRSFARHVQAVGLRGPLTAEVMADWARRDSHGSSDPQTWARRLKNLRSFTRWLQQFEPRTEVPNNAIFGGLHERLAPHIYSEQEIVDLLAAARRIGPEPGLRGLIYEMRISAHRGRRFRLIVDAISAGSWTAFQSDRGRRFSVIVDDGGVAQVIF